MMAISLGQAIMIIPAITDMIPAMIPWTARPPMNGFGLPPYCRTYLRSRPALGAWCILALVNH